MRAGVLRVLGVAALALVASGAGAQAVRGVIQRAPAPVPAVVPAAPVEVAPTPAAAMPTPVAGAPAPVVTPESLPPGQLRDCPTCPLMVLLPAGEFRYGTPPESPEAAAGTGESPAFAVRLAKPFLMSRTEITHAQFQAFADATGLTVEPRCQAFAGGWVVEDGMDWRTAGEATLAEASPDLPVTCVSWNDARAYVEWLSTTTGRKYRLPSEVEWEYAARAGSSAARSFVTKDVLADATDVTLCDNANVYDRSAIDSYPPRLVGHWQADCADGAAGLAKVAGRQPNAFDLVDLLGNAREWVQDCQTPSRTGAPLDGRAWEWSGCTLRGIRGGSFLSRAALARSAARERAVPSLRAFDLGFRVVRDATPQASPQTSPQASP